MKHLLVFQFDTMFMYMMSILMIIGIFEGYSVRKNDIIYHFNLDKAPKALQPSKVICFFVGPVYFFNFLGNWSVTLGIPLIQFVHVNSNCKLLPVLGFPANKL